MTQFSNDLSASAALDKGSLSADGSFSHKLSTAASRNNVNVDVQYNVVGDSGGTEFDMNDIVKTFVSFRQNAKPVPSHVVLHHYSTVDPTVSATINMPADVFNHIRSVFSSACFVLFLVGSVPGTASVALQRRDKISSIFEEICANRLKFESDPGALTGAIKQLEDMRRELTQRLERQTLVMQLRALSYDDLKGPFHVSGEDGSGVWIHSAGNIPIYALGRTGFSGDEWARLGIAKADNVAHVNEQYKFTSQDGTLNFPGASGIHGYVVGIEVHNIGNGDTNGLWCVRRDLALGQKSVRVDVKSDPLRGMEWMLSVYYIPASQYDE